LTYLTQHSHTKTWSNQLRRFAGPTYVSCVYTSAEKSTEFQLITLVRVPFIVKLKLGEIVLMQKPTF